VVLDWCNAKTAQHRSHLSTFRCADPEHTHFDDDAEVEYHDFPYEIEVQEHINALGVPAHPPTFLILGYIDERLAVVLQLTIQHFDRYAFIRTVATANWAKGNGYAQKALGVVGVVMAKYRIHSDYTVEAHVDQDNYRSQDLFERCGYHHVEMRDGYQVWARHFA